MRSSMDAAIQEVGPPLVSVPCRSHCSAKSLQSCLTLCNPWTVAPQAPLSMGILQVRILEWGAISFSKSHCGPLQTPPSFESLFSPSLSWTPGPTAAPEDQ